MGLQQQLPLRISGITNTGLLNTSEVSTQVRCVAQLRPIIGIVKPGGRMSTWKRPLLPRGKLSRPGRLVKALGHHTMQPNAFLDMHCTMLIKKATRRPMRILIPSLPKSAALLITFDVKM